MLSGPRVRGNNVYGITGDNPLTAGATTYNSVSLPLLPPVVAAHAIVVFDPKRVHGDPEIVVVTTHTAASTVATILRGQYGTSPRIHPQGTAWAHVPVNDDWTQILTSTTRPTNPYEGQTIYETDTDSVSFWEGAVWRGIIGVQPAGVRHQTITQSITNATDILLTYDTTDVLQGGCTIPDSSKIQVPYRGLYYVSGSMRLTGNATAGFQSLSIVVYSGSNVLLRRDFENVFSNDLAGTIDGPAVSGLVYLNAGERVALNAFQNKTTRSTDISFLTNRISVGLLSAWL